MTKSSVVIVGAGLAGLCCARRLHAAGVDFQLLEASDAVGGRMRTDSHQGFLLDRGFQVLLTAYPECKSVLDYGSLDLQPFAPGSVIRYDGRFQRLSDPWRQPRQALATVFSRVGGLGDKLKVARLRGQLRKKDLSAIFSSPEQSTLAALREHGFSERMIESFFRPFLGGVFLDPRLDTTSRMFEFVFKMFSEGDVAVPAGGMQRIPESIAAGLPPDALRFGARVERIEDATCVLQSGELLRADHVVVAVDGGEAARLTSTVSPPAWCGTLCLYFDAPEPPIDEAVLVLDGEGRGPVNNLCVMSRVAKTYAPSGRSLVAVCCVRPPLEFGDALEHAVREQLEGWFGAIVKNWNVVRAYHIERALPAQPVGSLEPPARPVSRRPGLIVCGDHVDNASINGAMLSGRRAAEVILNQA